MEQGYCLLEGRMPEETAASLSERFLALHADPAYKEFISGDAYYQTLFGMANVEDRVWDCIGHPAVLRIARYFLGPHCRFVEACSKPTWPGAPAQGLHVDSAWSFHEVPDVPWMINTMWMLTDFTAENGATGVVPGSHKLRLKEAPGGMGQESAEVVPITGRRGSVVLWHGGLLHVARANRSSAVRVGLNIAYYPRWFNNWIEAGHQPVWPETYERMPEHVRALCPGRRARSRDAAYESM
jgi:ectoine hydroxylase-related dioxygenase (phytanoyl-CoA dioxygenase family)